MAQETCKACGKNIDKRTNDPEPGTLWYASGDPTQDATYCGKGFERHQPQKWNVVYLRNGERHVAGQHAGREMASIEAGYLRGDGWEAWAEEAR